MTTDVLALRKYNTNQGQANCLTFFYGRSQGLASWREDNMTPTPSRSRQTAEIAFAKIQSSFLVHKRAVEGCDPIAQAREEKTLRLRNARLAKEADDRGSTAGASVSLPAKKA